MQRTAPRRGTGSALWPDAAPRGATRFRGAACSGGRDPCARPEQRSIPSLEPLLGANPLCHPPGRPHASPPETCPMRTLVPPWREKRTSPPSEDGALRTLTSDAMITALLRCPIPRNPEQEGSAEHDHEDQGHTRQPLQPHRPAPWAPENQPNQCGAPRPGRQFPRSEAEPASAGG